MRKEIYDSLPNRTKDVIISDTFAEFQSGTHHDHSLQSLFAEKRSLAVGARMNSGYIKINEDVLNGQQIADVFINSVLRFDYAYYPLTGDWKNCNVEQLILFVKKSDRYYPYARFQVDECMSTNQPPTDFSSHCIKPDLLNAFDYKSILKISNVEIGNLPEAYLAVTSGKDVITYSFKGSAPNILMI